MARNAGRARARKGERKDIIYTCKFCSFSFLFSYILYLKIYCLYVYVSLELVGHEDIEQNLNASPPAVSRNRGYLPTHHLRISQTHCPCVCVFVCMWEVLQSTPLFYHIFLGGSMLTFSSFTLGLSISKTAVLEIKCSNKYWKRAVDTPILAHCPLGK